METTNRARMGATLHLVLVALIVIALAACTGSTPAATADGTTTDTPVTTPEATPESADAGEGDLFEELEEAAEELDDFIDTDGDGISDVEGHVDDDDGTQGPIEGPVDPDNGFEPSLYVDGDDRGRILGQDPEAVCDRSELFRTETCTWTTGSGSESFSVEFSRDPNFATLEAYVEHMDVIMGSSDPIEDLGQAAYLGSNPLGSGVRLTAYVGDGLHIWVNLSTADDEAIQAELAVELARKIVTAMA